MSSLTERKAQFNLDRGTAPNQLNYSNNWMSYKGKQKEMLLQQT